ncbi:MAG: GAF domain-containing protein, partial [Planctomycetota bacterium]
MSPDKPKLLILGGPDVRPDELSAALGGRYEVVVAGSEGVDPASKLSDSSVAIDERLREQLLGPAAASAMLNAIGEGVCLTTPGGALVWANDRFKLLDEPVKARVVAVCREARDFFNSGSGGAKPGVYDEPNSATCKFDVVDEEANRFFEVYVSPADIEGAEPGHIAAVVRETTKRRRMEARMAAIDSAGAALINLEAEAVRTKNSAERLEMLQSRVEQHTHELLNFDHFVVRLTDDRTGKLELVMMVGMPPEVDDFDLYAEEEGSGISGLVAATGVSYICSDAEADERFLPGLGDAKSSLTVPLRLHDAVVGVVNVESRETAAFTDADRQFLEIFARYIAISLHILDLLVVERSATNQSVSGRVEGELRECLEDIVSEAEWISGFGQADPETKDHIARIKADVENIRDRVRNVASGPQTLLGVERAMAEREADPILIGK